MSIPIRIIEQKCSGFIIQFVKTNSKTYIPKNIFDSKIKNGHFQLEGSAMN